MGLLPFARYSIVAIARRRTRVLYSLAGTLLAVAMVAGTSIAIDSSSVSMLLSATRDIPVDFLAVNSSCPLFFDESYFEPTLQQLSQVESVECATALARLGGLNLYPGLGGWAVGTPNGTLRPPGTNLLFFPSDSEGLIARFGIIGKLPERGMVAVSKNMARNLDVGIGDWIVCSYESNGGTNVNLSFQVSRIWDQSLPYVPSGMLGKTPGSVVVGYSYLQESIWGATQEDVWHVDSVILNMDDANSVAALVENASQADYVMNLEIQYYVWVDRTDVFQGGNVDLSVRRLEELHSMLSDVAQPYGLEFYDSALSIPLKSSETETAWTRTIFIGLSLPVVAIGVYLSLVGIDLGMTERRLEIATLKARGASASQVRASLLLECSMLGFIGGVLGLVLGLLVSRIFVASAAGFLTGGVPEYSASDFLVNPLSVVSSIVLGICLMLLSAYGPVKRASGIPISQALHIHASSMERTEYKPLLDIMILGLVALSVGSVLAARIGIGLSSTASLSAHMVLYLVWGLGTVISPFVPFLLSFALVRLLTRGTRKLYSFFTPLVKPWTRHLHYIVEKNIKRNPRRASSLCLIMSLTLAFGVFVSVAMESTISHEAAVLEYEIGADLRAQADLLPMEDPQDINFTLLDEVEGLPGVSGVCRYSVAFLEDGFYEPGGVGNAVVLDRSAYSDVVRYQGRSFEDEHRTLELLQKNGTVLVREEYAELTSVNVGNGILVDLRYYEGINETRIPLQLDVVGTFDALPGFPSTVYYVLNRSTLGFLPDYLMQPYFGMFIDLAEGSDQRSIANATWDLFHEAGIVLGDLVLLDDQIDALHRDPKFGSLRSFLYNEYGLSLVMMTVGVGLVVFVSFSDRQRELASIMARGASVSQMRKILMGETIVLMVMSVVIGILSGFISGFLFNSAMQTADERGVPRELVLSMATGVVLLATIVSLLLSSFVATRRACKMRLTEVLRIRGG